MSSQYFIYDSDDGGIFPKNQQVKLKINEQIRILSAGLTEDVPIYQMVGQCINCSPEDIKWEPVTQCGVQLTLGPDNNSLWLYTPGTFSVGDPNASLTLTGDVNITGEKFRGVDPSILGKCNESGSDDYTSIITAIQTQTTNLTNSLQVICDKLVDVLTEIEKVKFTDMHVVCMVDDVNGDGTELVSFVEATVVSYVDGVITTTDAGTFTDEMLDTPYVTQGTVSTMCSLGSQAEVKQDSEELNGPNVFRPSNLTLAYTIRAKTSGVLFTGSNGVQRTLEANEVIQYTRKDDTLFDTLPVVEIPTGECAIITHTYLGET